MPSWRLSLMRRNTDKMQSLFGRHNVPTSFIAFLMVMVTFTGTLAFRFSRTSHCNHHHHNNNHDHHHHRQQQQQQQQQQQTPLFQLLPTSSSSSSSFSSSPKIPSTSKRWMTMSTEAPPSPTASTARISSAVKYSSSSGAALELSNVCLSIGNNDVMSKVEWTLLPKERWALVGRNGCGKSTLLKAITGTGGELVSIREGEVIIAKKARLGYLEQKGVSGSVKTVREEVSSRMDRLTAATKELEASEKAVSEGDTSDEALIRLEEAAIEFEAAGGYTVEQKIANVLKGLGFIEEDYDRYCSEFSGGWQMRIALARLLLSEPDLLLLDEPTNHLDKGAREWLGDYLSRYDGTLLLVSHDEPLLKAAVSSIAEVRGGTIELYKSRSHDQWLVEREERVRAAQQAFDANQREIARLQSFVDRFGAKTMGASLAQSKLKTIEKLEDAAPEAPKVDDGPLPFLKLPNPPRGSERLLELKGCTLAWPSKGTKQHQQQSGGGGGDAAAPAESAPSILKDVSLAIDRGSRIVVRGPNGAGKSTLLSALSGRLVPAAGSRIEGDGLALGVFTQDLAQDLDQEALAVDVVTTKVRATDPTISDEKARAALGALGLTGEKSVRKVGFLSGGEKARVALASFVLIPHNLLLLDEPSNHLDLTTLKVLTEALRKFEGSVVVISHDRTFLEELEPTHVITVRNGKVNLQERGLKEEDWDDQIDSRQECNEQKYAPKPAACAAAGSALSASAKEQGTKASAGGVIKEDLPKVIDNEMKKKIMNAPRRISKIESALEKHEKDKAKIDDDMLANGRNRGKLNELQKSKDEIQVKIDKLMVEYEELLELIS